MGGIKISVKWIMLCTVPHPSLPFQFPALCKVKSYFPSFASPPDKNPLPIFPLVLDQEGRAWRTNRELLHTDTHRDSMLYDITAKNMTFRTDLGKNQIMLRSPHSAQFVSDKERWMHRYDALREFHERYGHANVPVGSFGREDLKNEESPNVKLELGYWVLEQRREYRKWTASINCHMTEERFELLNQLDFQWHPQEENWIVMYEQLLHFYELHNHTNVIQRNNPLGTWMGKQRTLKRQNQLAEDRLKLLELIPTFQWDHKQYRWETMYTQLHEFYNIHGHCRVGITHNTQLMQWVKRQRVQTNRNSTISLTDQQIQKLNDINFDWAIYQYSWEDHYQHFINYKHANPSLRIPRHFNHDTDFPGLGNWVSQQRRLYKHDDLPTDKIDKLNIAGFIWDADQDKFMEMIIMLTLYYQEHGNSCVPAKYAHNKALGNWVNNIKAEYRRMLRGEKSRINQDRKEMLDELLFDECLLGKKG